MHTSFACGGRSESDGTIVVAVAVSVAVQCLPPIRPQSCKPLNCPNNENPGFIFQVGKGKCHIVDTFWQTETGGHVMLPLANVTPTKPGSCSFPFFGIEVFLRLA